MSVIAAPWRKTAEHYGPRLGWSGVGRSGGRYACLPQLGTLAGGSITT